VTTKVQSKKAPLSASNVASTDNKTDVKLARAKWHTHQRKMNVKLTQKQPLQYVTPLFFDVLYVQIIENKGG